MTIRKFIILKQNTKEKEEHVTQEYGGEQEVVNTPE